MTTTNLLEMTAEQLVPSSLVKDLIVGTHISDKPVILESLKTNFNYDFYQPLVKLSIQNYVALLEYTRQIHYPSLTRAEGLFLLGLASLEGHFQSTVGKINKVAARLLSLEKAANLYLQTQFYNYPFGSHQLEEVRKGYLCYRRGGVPVPPDFTRGVLTYLVQLTGGKNVKVTYQILGPDEILYKQDFRLLLSF